MTNQLGEGAAEHIRNALAMAQGMNYLLANHEPVSRDDMRQVLTGIDSRCSSALVEVELMLDHMVVSTARCRFCGNDFDVTVRMAIDYVSQYPDEPVTLTDAANCVDGCAHCAGEPNQEVA